MTAVPTPPRPPRPSAFMRSGDPARVAEQEERLAGDVQRAAIGQLLAGGPFAETLHLVLALLVAALIWDSLPVDRTIGWVAGVAAAARRSPSPSSRFTTPRSSSWSSPASSPARPARSSATGGASSTSS